MDKDIEELLNFMYDIDDPKNAKKEHKDFLKYLKKRRKDVEAEVRLQIPGMTKHYIESAIMSDDTNRIMTAALMLEYGAIFKQNLRKALDLYKVAASRDDDIANYYCAIFYSKGVGDSRDLYMFLLYLKKAMDLGNKDAKEQWDELWFAYRKYHNQ